MSSAEKWNDAAIKLYKFKFGFPNEPDENIQLPLGACKATLKIKSLSVTTYINTLSVWFHKYVVS